MSGHQRVLLTGASGFIGRHAQRPLLERGFEVHAVHQGSDNSWISPGVTPHRADLLSHTGRQGLLEAVKPTHLLHFAWYAVPGKYWTSSENLRWVAASLELTLAFAAQGGTRAVFAGTCAEYDWSFPVCDEFSTPFKPSTLYGTCKHALQSILSASGNPEQLNTAWGRIFFLYGEHEYPQRLVPSVINALLQDKPALCTHGRQIRDFMHVCDVAEAFVALLDSPVSGAVNIASGESQPLAKVISVIGEELGKAELIRLGARPTPPGEVDELRANVSRLQKEVGFKPKIQLQEGLRQSIEWWKARKAV